MITIIWFSVGVIIVTIIMVIKTANKEEDDTVKSNEQIAIEKLGESLNRDVKFYETLEPSVYIKDYYKERNIEEKNLIISRFQELYDYLGIERIVESEPKIKVTFRKKTKKK